MRSMKFKIIFVTTCLALNIDGLLADPALLFDIKFDTVEGQETYLKSQGIHNMEAFDPVRSFMGISMKPSVSSALPHFSEGTTPSDWTMVKMASDKKYIELAPGTEIYIKNNVSYEFKGIDELVVPTKLPVNEKESAGVQTPKVESVVGTQPKTEPVKEEKQNEDKSSQTVVDVKDSKPDIAGEKKLDPAAAITEDDAKDKPVDTKHNEKKLNKKFIAKFGSEANWKYFGYNVGMQQATVLNLLKCSYGSALQDFDFRTAVSFFNYNAGVLSTSIPLRQDILKNNMFSVSSNVELVKNVDGSYGIRFAYTNNPYDGLYIYVAFGRYFECMQPRFKRFIKLYDMYSNQSIQKSYTGFLNFLLAVLPEAFLRDFCVDYLEESFKNSIRNMSSIFFQDADNKLAEKSKSQLIFNILNKNICAYTNERSIANGNIKVNRSKFDLIGQKVDMLKSMYQVKRKKLDVVADVLNKRILNYVQYAHTADRRVSDKLTISQQTASSKQDKHVDSTTHYCPLHAGEELKCFICKWPPKCNNKKLHEYSETMICPRCEQRKAELDNGGVVDNNNSSSNVFNNSDLSKVILSTDVPSIYMNKVLPIEYFVNFEDLAIKEYNLQLNRYGKALNKKNDHDEHFVLSEDQIKSIEENPYRDADTFCLAALNDLVGDREPTKEQIVDLVNSDIINKVMKDKSKGERLKSEFTNLYSKIVRYFDTYQKTDENAQAFVDFKKCVLENSKHLFSLEKIKYKTFASVDYFKIIIKGKYFNIQEKKTDEFHYSDLAGDAVSLINTISIDNAKSGLLNYISQNINDKMLVMCLKKLSDIVNRKSVFNSGASNKGETTKFKLDVQSLITFNNFLIKHGIVDEGSVVTNERLDFFID